MDTSKTNDTNERLFALTDPDPDPTGDFDETLEELMAEFLKELRGKNPPSIDDFAKRHPEQEDRIRELFPTLTAMERLKLRREHSSDGHISLGPRTPERLGDFRIIREIGRGGMGVVFEAEQESLARHVAIKVIPGGLLLDASSVQRFEKEARTAASLHHSNIVPVFGVGEDDGMHYYVMQLIKGSGLDHCMTDEHGNPAFSPARVAELGLQAAEALAYAHDQGVLHRDIKPANLLLDDSGNLWITDFGLARSLEATQTASQSSGGTLRYMPPERFQGVSTKRGDVYSLGITLLELLAGRPAFTAATPQELIHQITNLGSVSVRSVDRNLHQMLPRDLRTIIEKACEGRSNDRYASASEMADDLRRFLEGRPIRARRVSPTERLWRWCRRNPLLASALSIAIVASLAVAIVSLLASRNTSILNRELSAALEGEREQREVAEHTSLLAIQAMNQVFDHFAPPGSLIATVQTQIEIDSSSGDASETEGNDLTDIITMESPALSPHVARALSDLLPFYNKLASTAGEDPQIRYYAAMAQYRVGLIHAQLGRFDEAADAYEASAESLSVLLQESMDSAKTSETEFHGPTPDEIRLSLARVFNDSGQSMRFLPQRDGNWTTELRNAIAILQADPPQALDGQWRLERARALLILGLPITQSQMSVLDLVNTRPGGSPGRRGRFSGISQMEMLATSRSGDLTSDWGKRYELISAALHELEIVQTKDATNESMRFLMACCLRERATLKFLRPVSPNPDDGEAAAEDFISSDLQQARALLQELVEEFPSRTVYLLELSDTCNREAKVILSRRDHSAVTILERLLRTGTGANAGSVDMPPEEVEAEALLRQAVEYSTALVENHPNEPAITLCHVKNLYNLAELLERRPADDAETLLREAVRRQRRLHQEFPDSTLNIFWDARVTNALCDILVESRRFDEAWTMLSDLLLTLATHEDVVATSDGPASTDSVAARQASLTDEGPIVLAVGETMRRLAYLNRMLGDPEKAAEFDELAAGFRDRGREWFERFRGARADIDTRRDNGSRAGPAGFGGGRFDPRNGR